MRKTMLACLLTGLVVCGLSGCRRPLPAPGPQGGNEPTDTEVTGDQNPGGGRPGGNVPFVAKELSLKGNNGLPSNDGAKGSQVAPKVD